MEILIDKCINVVQIGEILGELTPGNIKLEKIDLDNCESFGEYFHLQMFLVLPVFSYYRVKYDKLYLFSSYFRDMRTLIAVANSYLQLRFNFLKTCKVFRIRNPCPNSEHPDHQKKRGKTTKKYKNSWPFRPGH